MQFKPAPLKDRMTVYIGALVVLIVSWLYILGMGWHMNTLPFIDNPAAMNMNMDMDMDKKSMDMDMDKKSMDMDTEITLVDKVLSWQNWYYSFAIDFQNISGALSANRVFICFYLWQKISLGKDPKMGSLKRRRP